MRKAVGVIVAFGFAIIAFGFGVIAGVEGQKKRDFAILETVQKKLAEMPQGFIPYGNANSGLWASADPATGAEIIVVFRDGFAVAVAAVPPSRSIEEDDSALHDGERSEASSDSGIVIDCKSLPSGDVHCR